MSDKTHQFDKIASAIYLITGFFSDSEPLKWRLRTLAADLASEQIRDKNMVVRELISFFSIAKAANLVSDTNHNILVQELTRVSQELEVPLLPLLKVERLPEHAHEPRLSEPKAHEVIKDNFVRKPLEEKPVLKDFGAVSVKKNSRQSTIIALLKRKKEVMIKDVSPLITGCSEKTIQRELSEMVEAGILRKIGEKRWTRYTLA